jgi:hypothetical protein
MAAAFDQKRQHGNAEAREKNNLKKINEKK